MEAVNGEGEIAGEGCGQEQTRVRAGIAMLPCSAERTAKLNWSIYPLQVIPFLSLILLILSGVTTTLRIFRFH